MHPCFELHLCPGQSYKSGGKAFFSSQASDVDLDLVLGGEVSASGEHIGTSRSPVSDVAKQPSSEVGR